MATPEFTRRFFNSYTELFIVGTESELRCCFYFSVASALNRDTRQLVSPLISISFIFLSFENLVYYSIIRDPWSLRPPGNFCPKTVLLALLLFCFVAVPMTNLLLWLFERPSTGAFFVCSYWQGCQLLRGMIGPCFLLNMLSTFSFGADGRTPPLLPRRLPIGNPTGSRAVPLDVS